MGRAARAGSAREHGQGEARDRQQCHAVRELDPCKSAAPIQHDGVRRSIGGRLG
jgi:hypothetical protein